MPEHIRALIFILAIAGFVTLAGRKSLLDTGVPREEYRSWVLSWFGVTLWLFLSPGFWVFMFGLVPGLLLLSRRREGALASYFVLLLAVPGFIGQEIPGLGPIRYVIFLDYVRMLNLAVLLPLSIALYRRSVASSGGSRGFDVLVCLLILWMTLMTARAAGPTEVARAAVELTIDIALPYYVASRALTSLGLFTRTFAALSYSLIIIGALALFETWRGWLLYASLRPRMDVAPGFYLMREGGLLRAEVTSGQAIVLGYLLLVGIGVFTYLSPLIGSRWRAMLGWLALVGGIVASFSRGPWLGAVVTLLVIAWLGPRAAGRRIKLVFGWGLAVAVVLASPVGARIVPYLPFIGTVEAENVTYRQMLLEVSLDVMRQSLMLGDIRFTENPMMETMRQGQGIIDVVNTYLQVVLAYGIVGLGLFLLLIGGATGRVWLRHRRLVARADDEERLCRSLLGVMLGVMLTIASLSSIFVTPTVYWLLIGTCVAFLRLTDSSRNTLAKARAK